MKEFLAKNYEWFLYIAVMLIFALAGYFIEKSKNKTKSAKDLEIEKEIENLESITDPNATLGDMMGKNKPIVVNNDTSSPKQNKEPEKPEPINMNIDKENVLAEANDPKKMIIDEPNS